MRLPASLRRTRLLPSSALLALLGGCYGNIIEFSDSDSDSDSTTGSDVGTTVSETSSETADTETGECGNGAIEAGEQCDTGDLGGATCESEGLGTGGLTCTADCMFDAGQCSPCGNGMIDGDEDCDGADLGDSSTCADLGLGTAREPLGCTSMCTYDFGECSGCGDGMVTDPEACEPASDNLPAPDLDGQTCMSLGFDEGMLECTEGCAFDTANCSTCGDAVQQNSEACDGADFGGLACSNFDSPSAEPFDEGSLSCTGSCTIDTANCSLCTDGTVSGAEVCEPGVLEGETCISQGFDAGPLGCAADCSAFDTNACTDCGDALIEGTEQCEGNSLDGETCISQGFAGGTLGCANTCMFDTSMCTNVTCGDAVLNGGDQCDCGNQGVNCTAGQLGNQTCITQGFDGGTLACNSPINCTFNTMGCTECGDGLVGMGESCDGMNLNGKTCANLGMGFLGGTLSCTNACAFNTSLCTN